ncbi:hypothetical protein CNR22_16940 [Sphingobacteriaceae bacterium]|nr:hypothetical protein CNR22_16940 [Sphingobacteriaceae bacterium]
MKLPLRKTALAFSVLAQMSCTDNALKNENKTEIREIKITGSDTEYLMVKDLADAYMEEHPGVKIHVEGGGSNKGISALASNKTNICNSSREITEEELLAINMHNVNPVPIMFSVDAMAIITNFKVGVDSLSTEQVSKLFSGAIKNWKELGGDSVPVSLYGRDRSSGTRDYFIKKFLSDKKEKSITECATNTDVLNSVINNAGAIGYVGAGFLLDSIGKPNGKIWAMPIYIENHSAVSPYQTDAVKKGEYVITRPLYQYVNGVPDEVIQDFILFELTKRGQDIVIKHGFFPINDYQTQINRLKGLIN